MTVLQEIRNKVTQYNVLEHRAKILIVDDQPLNFRVMQHVFENQNYELFVATSGKQALTFCQNSPPDLVLMDVVMPEINGLETCRRLKSDENTREIPVIFVTAHSTDDEENACWNAGGVDFVAKPVNGRTLLNRVRVHLTLKFQADLLRELAFLDGLTRVANRRLFDERLELEWRRNLRTKTPLSLVLLDIDHFKAYNDFYGHQQGDQCLQQIAAAMASVPQRAGDLVARYGGEEFVTILPDTNESGAVETAERIAQAIRALQIPHEKSQTDSIVTVSLGVATLIPTLDEPPEALIKRTDEHLYEAKAQGRNCIVSGLKSGAGL